ncbi:hypothetical protein [Streptomyces sp. NPDC046985]|uniref:hypothetical protein n=1 Tax=Streptomyces sp. NPDC046985 TaxID=3155377 RepID=UPI0033ED74A8
MVPAVLGTVVLLTRRAPSWLAGQVVRPRQWGVGMLLLGVYVISLSSAVDRGILRSAGPLDFLRYVFLIAALSLVVVSTRAARNK